MVIISFQSHLVCVCTATRTNFKRAYPPSPAADPTLFGSIVHTLWRTIVSERRQGEVRRCRSHNRRFDASFVQAPFDGAPRSPEVQRVFEFLNSVRNGSPEIAAPISLSSLVEVAARSCPSRSIVYTSLITLRLNKFTEFSSQFLSWTRFDTEIARPSKHL